LNEMQTATDIQSDQVITLYTKVLDTALELAKVDQLKEAQTLDPEVVQRILGKDTKVLQHDFDELIGKQLKETLMTDKVKSMEDYAETLVTSMPEFAGMSVYSIRANGGQTLQRFIDELRKAAKD